MKKSAQTLSAVLNELSNRSEWVKEDKTVGGIIASVKLGGDAVQLGRERNGLIYLKFKVDGHCVSKQDSSMLVEINDKCYWQLKKAHNPVTEALFESQFGYNRFTHLTAYREKLRAQRAGCGDRPKSGYEFLTDVFVSELPDRIEQLAIDIFDAHKQ